MASRQNLSGRGYRGGRGGGYGFGPLAGAYGGPANLVNPKMEEWRRQQKSSKGIDRTSAAQKRIAQAQQTGVGRGTQEQIVRHTTPGGGGYNRAEAIARERQLATRSEAEQMAMLGRLANPNAGQPGAEKFDSGLEGKSLEGAINGGGPLQKESKWTPEARKRWRQDQEDLKNPFGPRMRKDEEGKWSAEQKQAWQRGETPRQQMAGITGGQAGMDRAMRRMAANTGRERQAQAAETPWDAEARQAAEAEKARKMGEARAKPAVEPQQPGGRRGIWGGFKGRGGFMGRIPGMMNRARQAALAKQGGQTGFGFGGMRRSPGSKGAISNSGYDPRKISGFGGSRRRLGGATAPKRRTGGIGGASKTGGSIRSRGLRGRGIGRGMGGTL